MTVDLASSSRTTTRWLQHGRRDPRHGPEGRDRDARRPLDSWHCGTGATDNGAGCAVMMEAVRILKTLGLKPRRTIRIALWSGEEEGLLGSREYVKEHFGWIGAMPTAADLRRHRRRTPSAQHGADAAALTKGKPEFDKLSAYFNLDNGTGKIRGVYMQGNEAVRPIFRTWLEPFRDPHGRQGHDSVLHALDSNTGGTDHLSFDGDRPARLPVHPGRDRVLHPDAPLQHGRLRPHPGRRHEAGLDRSWPRSSTRPR